MSESIPVSEKGSSRPVAARALLVAVCMAIGLALAVWLRPLQVLFAGAQVALRMQGMHSEYVQIDGYRLHYYAGGQGKPIVLVHGLGGRSEDWTFLIPHPLRGGYRVYALDLLGYGRSERPADAAYSISQEAMFVEHFIASQRLQQTDLAGWSMGGWVAMRAALDSPQTIRRLVLMDSAGLRFVIPYDPAIFWATTPVQLAKLNDLLSPGKAPALPGFIERDLLRVLARNGWVIQRSLTSMMTGADLVDGKAGDLKMPVLLVWGKQDQITPLALAYELHKDVPQSVLEIFDGCGHLAPRECAPGIGPRLLNFLNAAQTPAAEVTEIPAPGKS